MKALFTLIAVISALSAFADAQIPAPLTPTEKVLIESAYQGELGRVQGLIAKGARVDAADETGRTALMWAALRGHTPVVEFLHGRGANINAKDSDGQTALIYACRASRPHSVEFLLKNGAEVNVRSRKQGITPLIAAAMAGNVEVVRLLLVNAADASIVDQDGIGAEQLAREFGHAAVAELLQSPPATPSSQP